MEKNNYICFAKIDETKEAIYTLQAPNLYAAIQSFAQLKQLTPDQLLEIYNIERTEEDI